jgi:hypothetical protein
MESPARAYYSSSLGTAKPDEKSTSIIGNDFSFHFLNIDLKSVRCTPAEAGNDNIIY